MQAASREGQETAIMGTHGSRSELENERESGVGRGCFTSTRMEMERGKLGHGTLAFDDAKQGFYTQSRDSKGQVFYGQR